MDITEIQNKLVELKASQGDFFKKKKGERDADALQAVRNELNELKKKAAEIYKENRKKK